MMRPLGFSKLPYPARSALEKVKLERGRHGVAWWRGGFLSIEVR